MTEPREQVCNACILILFSNLTHQLFSKKLTLPVLNKTPVSKTMLYVPGLLYLYHTVFTQEEFDIACSKMLEDGWEEDNPDVG